MDNIPKRLLTLKRNGFVDDSYFGSFFIYEKNNLSFNYGIDDNNIVFMRSLAKPFQAAIGADSDILTDYKFSNKMLAIFQGSHSGDINHILLLKDILKKYKIKVSDIEIKKDTPLDMRHFDGKKTKLHNNCSAKHIFMILNSRYLGFDIKNYTNENHPIQKLIYKKQTELTNYKSSILSFDGCGTPLWGLPIKSLINGYFNYFNHDKYKIFINAVLKYPHIFGGNNRLDSEIISKSNSKLYAKVGAGGFVLIYNFKKDAILLIKLAQNNNEIRRLLAFKILNDIGWLDFNLEDCIYNQQNTPVAKYCYEFNI